MRELELVAEYDRPRGLIIPGDPFQEHPGRRYAHVPGRKPDDCDGGWGEGTVPSAKTAGIRRRIANVS